MRRRRSRAAQDRHPCSIGSPAIDTDQRIRRHHVEIFLISFASLLLEISYTRVISFKLFYYYTYFVLGLALLGIGCGGVVVAVSDRLRAAATETVLRWGLLGGAASIGAGYVVVANTNIATRDIWDYGSGDSVTNVIRLLVICVALFASFVAVGLMVATLFGRAPTGIGRLYFADLAGAALACAIVVALLSRLGAPATIFLAALLLALAGLRLAVVSRATVAAVVAVGLVAVTGLCVVRSSVVPVQRTDRIKTQLTAANTDYSAWSPIFRVDAVKLVDRLLLYHDGLPGSAIYPFAGDVAALAHFDRDLRSLPFAVLGPDRRSDVMIVGAAGGHEVLTSLYYRARHVDAVELNPVTYGLVKDRYADYSGHLADQPDVHYVVGDGRSYLARTDHDYDLVWFPAPDSYAATNAASASALVLSESYLYTSEAVTRSLDRAGRDGIVVAQFGEVDYQHKPNRTARYVSTARDALRGLGVDDPTNHVMVSISPTDFGAASVSTIVVKRGDFTAAEVDRFTAQLAQIPGASLEYAPGRPNAGTPVSRVITTPTRDLDRWYRSYAYDVRPVRDDSPFFWHFSPFGDVIAKFTSPIDRTDLEVAAGERVLLLLVGVAVVLGAAFLLLPFITIRRVWGELPRKASSALYFAALGLGFMFFEVTLIQRLTLFLGYPTYSLTVTLASILLFTGLGALASERFAARPVQSTVAGLLVPIAGLTAFYALGLRGLTNSLLLWPLAARIAVAFAVLAPLGLCLGMFMPLGLRAIAASTTHEREYVAWGWAVNGFASVVGAALTTVLAMTFGFGVVLLLGLAIYGVAGLAIRRVVRT